MAFFRCTGLDSGGSGKTASGTFTTQASSQFVSCGFKPTRVMVMSNIIPSGVQGYLQLCFYWNGTSKAIVIQNLTNVPTRSDSVFITPVDGGFEFVCQTGANYQGKDAYFIAVG